ncbi:MAG: hypothetical protein AAFO07_29765, partial [Bacteroidota bacterium]
MSSEILPTWSDNCSTVLDYRIEEDVQPDSESGGLVTTPVFIWTAGELSSYEFGVGTSEITYRLQDNTGFNQTCSFLVTINDEEAPEANCQNVTIQLDDSGNATLTALQVDDASTDNCSIVSRTLDQASFDCTDAGKRRTVTLTIKDAAGNMDQCSAYVFPKDNVTPEAKCRSINATLDPIDGTYTLTAEMINAGSVDACGIANLILDKTNFDCNDKGNNIVELTVVDNNNKQATCTANVNLTDATAPVAICQPITVQLNESGNASATGEMVNNGSSDACGIFSFTLDKTNFDCNNVGDNSVTLTVTDNNNLTATCNTTITVEDNIAPEAKCQPTTVQLDNNGIGTTTAATIDNGSTDACGIANLSLNQTMFGCGNKGRVPVTLTVTDVNGNVATCATTVTVEDKVAPRAVCNPLTVQLNSSGTASVPAVEVGLGSEDACGVTSITISDGSYDCEDVGENPETITVTDVNGNVSTCNTTITVEDKIAPTAICQPITIQLDENGNASTTAVAIDNGSSDICGISNLTLDKTNFDCSEKGDNPVTLSVRDNNGNTSTCNATITVEDNRTPTAVCQDITVQLNGTTLNLNPSLVGGNSYDNCGISSLTLDKTSFNCSDMGSNDVTLTISDDEGALSACSAVVTIENGIDLPNGYSTTSLGPTFGDATYNACEEEFTLNTGRTSTYNYREGWGEMTYLTLEGDFIYSVQLKSHSSNAVAGLMVRHGSSSGDMMGFVGKYGYGFTGGVTLNGSGRVMRTGSSRGSRAVVFTVTRTGNTLTFTQGRTTLLQMELNMGSNAMVGMFVSSSNDDEATATFHNVSYSGSVVNSTASIAMSSVNTVSPLRGQEGGITTLELNTYPNPTQGLVNIELKDIIGNTAVLKVYNTIGEITYTMPKFLV